MPALDQDPDPEQGPDRDPAPRRRKPRRFTAEPRRVSESSLVGVFELPHGAGRLAPSAPGEQHPAPVEGTETQCDDGNGIAPTAAPAKPAAPKAEPVIEQRAVEDDPRAWGDGADDLGEWMKSQRPPHWD